LANDRNVVVSGMSDLAGEMRTAGITIIVNSNLAVQALWAAPNHPMIARFPTSPPPVTFASAL
jgi:hypothetical protein